ncbi:MAG: DUF3488 domain-containing protein, partial [Acidimicrobiia bacterium]|nr:DUF3488 domain-containing protein [Acidimicrobiia bacterium]
MRRLLAVELAAIATLSIVAALGWHRVFLGGGYLLPAIGAAALAVATSTVLGFVRRLSVLATGLVNIVAFGLFVMAAVLNDTMRTGLPTLSTFAEMARGLTGGWADLLTATLPTASEPRMLVSVAAVSWIGAGISAELVQRRRGVLGPVVGPLGAYTVTLMASASEPSSPLGLPLALIGVALLAVLVHANRWATMEPDGQRVRGLTAAAGEIEPSVELSADRRVMTGLPIVALAVACALAASALPASALRHRFDPRSLRSQEIEELPQISPLASVYAQLTAPEEREIFQIAVAPADRAFVTEVRLAALDRFDGATWSTSGRYAKVASILPDRGLSSVETRLVDQEYLLRDPSGPWLPVVAMPISLSLARSATVGYDSASGTALVSDGLAPEFRYSVRSEVAVPSDDAIAQAVAGSADEAGPFALELPAGMPDSLAAATS